MSAFLVCLLVYAGWVLAAGGIVLLFAFGWLHFVDRNPRPGTLEFRPSEARVDRQDTRRRLP